MARKLKDNYDYAFAEELADRIKRAWPAFDRQEFRRVLEPDLLELGFLARQDLFVQALETVMTEDYVQTIRVFLGILGPELKTFSR